VKQYIIIKDLITSASKTAALNLIKTHFQLNFSETVKINQLKFEKVAQIGNVSMPHFQIRIDLFFVI